MQDKFMSDKEYKFREEKGTQPVDSIVCDHCTHLKKGTKEICWECDSGSNFENITRSISEIKQLIHNIDTQIGEANMIGDIDEIKLVRLIGVVHGLNWVMKKE